MSPFLTWALARAEELTTKFGGGIIASVLVATFHLPQTRAAIIGEIAGAMLGAGMMAATTKSAKPLLAAAEAQLPEAIELAQELTTANATTVPTA